MGATRRAEARAGKGASGRGGHRQCGIASLYGVRLAGVRVSWRGPGWTWGFTLLGKEPRDCRRAVLQAVRERERETSLKPLLQAGNKDSGASQVLCLSALSGGTGESKQEWSQ